MIPDKEFPVRNSKSCAKFRMRKFLDNIHWAEDMAQQQERILDTVLRRLDAAKGEWPRIAAESGVPYQTITKIGGRFVTDPRISSVQALYDYFEAHPMPRQDKSGPAAGEQELRAEQRGDVLGGAS